MICVVCGGDTRVIDSRPTPSGKSIKRRRRCLVCDRRFSTLERRLA